MDMIKKNAERIVVVIVIIVIIILIAVGLSKTYEKTPEAGNILISGLVLTAVLIGYFYLRFGKSTRSSGFMNTVYGLVVRGAVSGGAESGYDDLIENLDNNYVDMNKINTWNKEHAPFEGMCILHDNNTILVDKKERSLTKLIQGYVPTSTEEYNKILIYKDALKNGVNSKQLIDDIITHLSVLNEIYNLNHDGSYWASKIEDNLIMIYRTGDHPRYNSLKY